MRMMKIQVPDSLWTEAHLSEGAKLLWCYLRAVQPERQQFTFGDLRRAVGICQNSLLKYLKELAETGWLHWTRTGLRRLNCRAVCHEGSAELVLPTDLLFDHRLSHPTKWVWGLIHRIQGPVDYRLLIKQTGYCQESLSKYLHQLSQTGWLLGKLGRGPFILQPANPFAVKRKAELDDLERVLEVAKHQEGYSMGQSLLARMVRLIAAENMIVENAEVTGLDNLETGGRMHYDLLLPKQKVAFEFQGAQHDGPTERFSSPEAFGAQRRRDLLKRGLSLEQGIDLLVVRPEDLRFERLQELLATRIPTRQDVSAEWHIYERLERTAANYRKKAAQHRRAAS